MSRQISNFLSLELPINNEVSYVTSRSPIGPPPDFLDSPNSISQSPLGPPGYVPQSPLGPPPGYLFENTNERRSVRAPRRCSLCRQVGHNRNICTTVVLPVPAVTATRHCSICRQVGHNRRACPSLPSVPAPPTEGQKRMQLRRIIQDFLEFSYPNGSWRRELEWIAVFGTYVCSLTLAQVEEGIENPTPIIREVVRILYRISHPEYPTAPRPSIVRGKDHAKQISIVLDSSCVDEEEKECFICCEEKCTLKTSCGHEFCGGCVRNIIEVGKNTTSSPVCSFCRVPFTCLTTSIPSEQSTLANFINNL
jgi:hypothetical protein